MKIAVAPYMPLLTAEYFNEDAFRNLALEDLPYYVTLIIYGKWEDILWNNPMVMASYELMRLLLEKSTLELIPNKKANYIKINPDILNDMSEEERSVARQQMFAMYELRDSRRIFAGAKSETNIFEVSSDRNVVVEMNFNPYGMFTLLEMITSFEPRLEQMKHSQDAYKVGNKVVSPFSAYDKNDESYARNLLRVAYEDHDGDITDRTYLYTYDRKYKTFVEFRPGRNNTYHGMDIDLKTARAKAPDVVKRYHK